MKKFVLTACCLFAQLAFFGLSAQGYDYAGLNGGPRGVNKFAMVKHPSGKKCSWLWYSSPRLDNQWKDVSFAFTPDGDGLMIITIGSWAPWREGDIPYYFDDIRINGVPVDLKKGWTFNHPPSGEIKIGSVYDAPGFTPSGKPCLRLYHGRGARCEFVVKKGKKVVVTMKAKAGSVLDAYAARLSIIADGLDECTKIAAACGADAGKLSSARKLTECINAIISMSKKELHVSVPPLSLDSGDPAELKKKLLELVKAYEAEVKRTAGEKKPIFYGKLEVRKEFLNKIRQAALLASKLKTDLLLNFMFSGSGTSSRRRHIKA